jgi:hypothetical protein
MVRALEAVTKLEGLVPASCVLASTCVPPSHSQYLMREAISMHT